MAKKSAKKAQKKSARLLPKKQPYGIEPASADSTASSTALDSNANEAGSAGYEETSEQMLKGLGRIPTMLRRASARRPRFSSVFVFFALTILGASTVVWSTLGALINQHNADQLVNSYLFENGRTFQEAVFPSQHTFLLKWPLFWIIKLLHFSDGAFIGVTVLTALATVAALAWFIYKIERRPFYFGTICLALASVLLLIPAQPYAGGLLPVNMAMTTTRNLEYVIYIAIIASASRLFTIKSWRFAGVIAALTLLIASDKLFASLAVGSGILGYIAYAAARHKKILRRVNPWLIVSIASVLLATVVIQLINRSGLTHILGSSGAGPYALSFSPRNLILGSFYAIAGMFTNLGGNPGFDAMTLRDIPRIVFHHLYSPAGLAYLTNAVIVVAGLAAAGHIGYQSIGFRSLHGKKVNQPGKELGRAYFVSLVLVASSFAATAAFILTNHDYVVDARYVSIWLFAIFICLATYSRGRTWPLQKITAVIGIFIITIIGGSWGAFQNFYSEKNALASVTARNLTVAHVLQQRHTDLLVGDYWRVLPIKSTIAKPITALPLASCSQPRDVLTSKAWQPDLHRRSFAYLLSLDKGLTDFQPCTLQNVIDMYGRPNSSVVIDGKLANPKEVVLFYDHGITKSAKHEDRLSQAAASILPVTLDKLPESQTKCVGRQTIMNIVAHEDDDLLFMNPDLSHDISAGHCVRTVYLTAGDAGSDEFYWLGREHGSEAAYDVMDGPKPDSWIQRYVDIGNGRYATIASPRQNYDISLVFLHLPDGGLQGQGFPRSHNVSLDRLQKGVINNLRTVDGQSSYDAPGLVQAIAALMRTFQPTEIRTQADYNSSSFPDHSDHRAVSRFVTEAKKQYATDAEIPLIYYLGYPVREFEENVSGEDLDKKQAAFFAYGQSDRGVCQSAEDCANVATYYSYLHRQYTYTP